MTSHPDPLAPLRPLGAVLNPDLVQATYRVIAPLAAALDPATTAARYDIAYGPHPRNRLDLYRPAGDAPVEAAIACSGSGRSSPAATRAARASPSSPISANGPRPRVSRRSR